MKPARITDDQRILLALLHGYDVRRQYKPGVKYRSAPADWVAIEKDGARLREVSIPSIIRVRCDGMIVKFDGPRADSYDGSHSYLYVLTDAGRAAAQAIEGISIERVIAPPKSKAQPVEAAGAVVREPAEG